jgi:predicted alpha/beta hydrolase family esterase
MADNNGDRAFLILHGWENRRPADHWQHWLAMTLLGEGEIVSYPQLPMPDEPSLDDWMAALERQLHRLSAYKVTIVCHSLACSLWLTYSVSGRWKGNVSRVALVSVPSPRVLESELVAPFVDERSALGEKQEVDLIVVSSDNDPYCPEGVTQAYRLHQTIPVFILPNAEHIRPTSGYGAWPAMLAWCLERAPFGPKPVVPGESG